MTTDERRQLYQHCALFAALQSKKSSEMFSPDHFENPFLRDVFEEVQVGWKARDEGMQVHQPKLQKWLEAMNIEPHHGATRGLVAKCLEITETSMSWQMAQDSYRKAMEKPTKPIKDLQCV